MQLRCERSCPDRRRLNMSLVSESELSGVGGGGGEESVGPGVEASTS